MLTELFEVGSGGLDGINIRFHPSPPKIAQLEAFMYHSGKNDPLYHASKVSLQDQFACISQGPVTDRTEEHLGRSDVGVTLLRRLVREAVQELDAGRAPRGQLRQQQSEIIRFDNVF